MAGWRLQPVVRRSVVLGFQPAGDTLMGDARIAGAEGVRVPRHESLEERGDARLGVEFSRMGGGLGEAVGVGRYAGGLSSSPSSCAS